MKETAANTSRAYVIRDPAVQKRLIPLLWTVIFFSVLNNTMFNVSIPDIAQQFHLMPSVASWVMSGFVVVFGISSVTYGRLADSYAIKDLITIGLILFNLGSLIGLLSQWYPMLIVARVIQASGGGAIPALGMLIATRYFPPDMSGKVLGLATSAVCFGGGIGPIAGGFITGTFHWRYLFILSTITLLTIRAFRRHLPEQAGESGPFDTAGALLMAGSVGALLFFVTLTRWWIVPVGMGLTIWLLAHIHRSRAPFLNPSLFRNHRYRTLLIVAFLSLSTVFGMIFMTPLMLRALNRLGSGHIGLVMFPGAMISALLGTIIGRWVDKKGGIPVLNVSLVLLITGYLLLSSFAGFHPWVVSLVLVVCFSGYAMLQTSIAHAISSTLPAEQLGIGMGMYNLFFFLSGAFSAAVLGKLLDLSADHPPVNPLAAGGSGGAYSNGFLLLTASVLTAASILHAAGRRNSTP